MLDITYFLPPTRTFIVNLLSGASSPISILAAMIALVEEGEMNSLPGDANTGGSNIWMFLTNGVWLAKSKSSNSRLSVRRKLIN